MPQYGGSREDEPMLNAGPPEPRQKEFGRTEAQWDWFTYGGECRHREAYAEISMVTPRGQFRVRAGVVGCLPVPVLVGRDCQAFAAYWTDRAAEGRRPPRHQRHRSFRHQPTPTPEESTDAEAMSPEEDRASASEDMGGAQVRKDLESHEVFSEFPPAETLQGERLGPFATAQLQDPVFTQAWRSVQMIEGQLREGVSRVTYPYFMIKNKLLYRVDQRRGEICEQLLVPKAYTSKVLYLAHTHLLGGHLGSEKTYECILTRFY